MKKLFALILIGCVASLGLAIAATDSNINQTVGMVQTEIPLSISDTGVQSHDLSAHLEMDIFGDKYQPLILDEQGFQIATGGAWDPNNACFNYCSSQWKACMLNCSQNNPTPACGITCDSQANVCEQNCINDISNF